MSARTTLELVPLLASLLVAAPTWALEPCYAVAGATLQCGRREIRVRGVVAAPIGTPAGDAARERLQERIGTNTLRMAARSADAAGLVAADVYVGGKGYSAGGALVRQRHVGPRPEIDASSCRVVDGDSLTCGRERVRISGIRAAERGEAGHARARERLERITQSGQVRLVPRAHDRYGRTVADLYVDGRRIRQRDIGPRRGSGSSH
jgi:endonuclease YncB( thermonuclease family)